MAKQYIADCIITVPSPKRGRPSKKIKREIPSAKDAVLPIFWGQKTCETCKYCIIDCCKGRYGVCLVQHIMLSLMHISVVMTLNLMEQQKTIMNHNKQNIQPIIMQINDPTAGTIGSTQWLRGTIQLTQG